MQERSVAPSQVTVKTVAVVCFTVAGVAGLVFLVSNALYAIGILIGAVLLAVALHHGVDFLVKHRFRRRPAIATVLGTFFALLAGLFLLLIPPAVSQGRELTSKAPALVDRLRHTSAYESLNKRLPVDRELQRLLERGRQSPGAVVEPAMRAVGSVLHVLGAVVAIVASSIFVLIFGGPLVHRMLGETLPGRRERYERVLRKIYTALGGYITGLGFICGANAVATTVFLMALRLPFFLPLGILSGISSLIPFVGATIMGVVITLVAFVAGGTTKGLIAAGFFLLYQQAENHLLAPLVYRRTVQVNPVVNIAAMLVMSELAGIAGAILAVPAVAALQIVLREVLRYRREQLDAPVEGPLSESTGPLAEEAEETEQQPQLHS